MRAAENKPALMAGHEPGVEENDGDRSTHEYEDAVHVILEGMDPSFVVALCFT